MGEHLLKEKTKEFKKLTGLNDSELEDIFRSPTYKSYEGEEGLERYNQERLALEEYDALPENYAEIGDKAKESMILLAITSAAHEVSDTRDELLEYMRNRTLDDLTSDESRSLFMKVQREMEATKAEMVALLSEQGSDSSEMLSAINDNMGAFLHLKSEKGLTNEEIIQEYLPIEQSASAHFDSINELVIDKYDLDLDEFFDAMNEHYMNDRSVSERSEIEAYREYLKDYLGIDKPDKSR